MRIFELLMEGGNVFAGKTASIKRENIEPTISAYFKELKKLFPKKANIFNSQHFVPLGSVGKKAVSGDIDLGISASDILDKTMSDASISLWGIDPLAVHNEALSLEKRARTSGPERLRMKAFLKILTAYINSKNSDLSCNEKKVTDGNIFGLFPQFDESRNNLGIGVQIDWMIGDLNWLKFSYFSSAYPEGSNVKGLHGSELLASAFQVANLMFSHINGIKDKTTNKYISHDPQEALNILGDRLGVIIPRSEVEDYYRLHSLLKSKMRPEDYNTLLNVYFKILDSTHGDIPDNLQKEWLKRKNSLGLTGKFLPDNSALKNK